MAEVSSKCITIKKEHVREYLSLDDLKNINSLQDRYLSDLNQIELSTPIKNLTSAFNKKLIKLTIGDITISGEGADIVSFFKLIVPNKINELLSEQKNNENDEILEEAESPETREVWNNLNKLAELVEDNYLNGKDPKQNTESLINGLVKTIKQNKDNDNFIEFFRKQVSKEEANNSPLCLKRTFLSYVLDLFYKQEISFIRNSINDAITYTKNDFNGSREEDSKNYLENARILRYLQELSEITKTEFADFQKENVSDFFITEPMKTKIYEIIKFSQDLDFDELKNFLGTNANSFVVNSLSKTFLSNVANEIDGNLKSSSQLQRAINKSIFNEYITLLHQNPPKMITSEYSGCGKLDS